MKTITLLLAFAVFPVSSQTYTDDSVAVRAILDTNGLTWVTVKSVTNVTESRISSLRIQAPGARFPPSSMRALTALQSLDISGCELSELPPELTLLEGLRTLRINANPLDALPAWLGELDSLRELDAPGCGLSQLPPEIGRLANLQLLGLDGNRLTSLPDSIRLLSNLNYANLSGNLLNALPESIGDMPRFGGINLSNNQFKHFPECLTRLAYMREINMDSNSLSTLPESVGALENLGSFSLNSNELAILPGSVTNVGKKAGLFLFVNDNRLCALPDSLQAWLDDVTSDLWDWRTTQRCPQSAVTPPAMASASSRALSVVSHGVANPVRIEYRITAPGPVRIQVWNAAGGLVCVPVDRFHVPGTYAVPLAGTRLAGGTYLLRMVDDSRQILARQLIAK